MNPNQFRRGNYFLSNSVQVINEKHLESLKDSNYLPAHDINPIRISEDWLLTFGFRKMNRSWRSANPMFTLEVFGRGKFFLNTPSKTLEVFWIHQLQNLYMEITGEELLIKEKAW